MFSAIITVYSTGGVVAQMDHTSTKMFNGCNSVDLLCHENENISELTGIKTLNGSLNKNNAINANVKGPENIDKFEVGSIVQNKARKKQIFLGPVFENLPRVLGLRPLSSPEKPINRNRVLRKAKSKTLKVRSKPEIGTMVGVFR